MIPARMRRLMSLLPPVLLPPVLLPPVLLLPVLLLPVLVLLAGPGRATIRHTDDVLVDESLAGALRALPRAGFPIPDDLEDSHDVYLMIQAGGRYAWITAVGPPGIAPKPMAQALESALRGTSWQDRTVVYGDNLYPDASVRFSTGRLWAREGSMEVPVGVVLANLRRAGWKPHAVIRVANSVAAQAPVPPWRAGPHFTVFAGDGWPSGAVLRTQARLTRFGAAWTVLVLSIFPVASLAVLLVGLVVFIRPGVAVEERRHLFLRVASTPCVVFLLCWGPMILAFTVSRTARFCADLWFGQAAADDSPLLWAALGAFIGSLFLFLLPLAYLEMRLLHRPKGERPPKREAWLLPTQAAKALVAERARPLAERMGAPFRSVEIDSSDLGQRNANAWMKTGGRLRVTLALVETLNPGELDFILAHELAHSKNGEGKQRWLALFWLLPLAPLFARGLLLRVFGDPLWVPLLVYLSPTLTSAAAITFLHPCLRRREFAADLLALSVTGDLPSAVSALQKIAWNSDMRYVHDADDQITHPKLSKRLGALRQAAADLGLEAPAA